jgi:hypothetical protein
MLERASSVVCRRSTSFLRGARARGKARNEFVELRDLLFPLRVFGFDARADRRLGHHHVVVAAVVHDHGFVIDVRDVRAHAIQKMAIVRDDDQHAFVFEQVVLQPVHGVEVQVVRGFVQQQGRRAAEKRLRQQHADFLPALQFAHLAIVQRLFQAQAVKQDCRICFGGVAAFFADDTFQLAQAHSVRIGEFFVRLGVENFAFLESLPERAIAHDHGINHAMLVEGELVLAQDAELFRTRDVALGRLDFAGQDLHQRGFTGAVGAGDSIAPSCEEGGADIFEQDSGAEAHRDVVNGEQGTLIVAWLRLACRTRRAPQCDTAPFAAGCADRALGSRVHGGVHVSRWRADRAYVGMAHTKEEKNNEHRDNRTSRIRRGRSSARVSSAAAGGRPGSLCRRRQSNDISRGAGSAAADLGASASAAQSGAICAADRDAVGDQSERGAKLFGNAARSSEITANTTRILIAQNDMGSACRFMSATTKSVIFEADSTSWRAITHLWKTLRLGMRRRWISPVFAGAWLAGGLQYPRCR